VLLVAECGAKTEWSQAVRMLQDEVERKSLVRETASRPDVVGLDHMCALHKHVANHVDRQHRYHKQHDGDRSRGAEQYDTGAQARVGGDRD